MSYADDLAKDRDKYLRQRNKLASELQGVLDAIDRGDNMTDAALKRGLPVLREARTTLNKIMEPDAIERMVGG